MHDPDKIIARVLQRYVDKADSDLNTGRSRGVLVVDPSVAFLETALKEANFRVTIPRTGTSDAAIELLAHRVLVTRNTSEFLADAPVHEYGIIGLDGLRFIDSSTSYTENTTAKLVSAAYSEFDLPSQRSCGFVLMLQPDGKHVFRRLS